jgi:peptide/nickel transport system substrate-binding protein
MSAPRPPLATTAVVMGLTLLGLIGCRGQPRPRAPLVIAHESDIVSFQPTSLPEPVRLSVLGNFYEGLVAFDGESSMQPALAVHWLTPDPLTWRFRIRQGVSFHDGSPLTALDVKVSLDRARSAIDSGVRGYLSAIASIEVGGEDVLIRTSRPDPLLLKRLSFVFISPARILGTSERPAGTGPYRVASYEEGRIEAHAFGRHWGRVPAIERVVFRTVPAGDVVAALKQGSVDVLRWVPEGTLAEARAVPGYRVVTRDGLRCYFLWLNAQGHAADRPNPLADRRVRQALSHAIDRKALTDTPGGLATPLTQLVHKGIFGFVPELPRLAHDAAYARRLIAEAGYPKGFSTTLAFRDDAGLEPIVVALKAMLERVGIRVEPRPMPWRTMLEATWRSRRQAISLAGWQFDEGAAWGLLRDCIHTQDPTRTYGASNAGYSDAEMDRLIDAGDQVFEGVERRAHYREIMRLALDEMPLVPLYARRDSYAVSRRVHWQPRIDGSLRAAEMSWNDDPS